MLYQLLPYEPWLQSLHLHASHGLPNTVATASWSKGESWRNMFEMVMLLFWYQWLEIQLKSYWIYSINAMAINFLDETALLLCHLVE